MEADPDPDAAREWVLPGGALPPVPFVVFSGAGG